MHSFFTLCMFWALFTYNIHHCHKPSMGTCINCITDWWYLFTLSCTYCWHFPVWKPENKGLGVVRSSQVHQTSFDHQCRVVATETAKLRPHNPPKQRFLKCKLTQVKISNQSTNLAKLMTRQTNWEHNHTKMSVLFLYKFCGAYQPL